MLVSVSARAFRRNLRFGLCASVIVFAIAAFGGAQSQVPEPSAKVRPVGTDLKEMSLQYWKIAEPTIESRLQKYSGSDLERQASLRQMFKEAGCTGADFTEQRVTGLRESNVICVLPGATSRTIIVGAHFDHAADTDGVVDNWSGASLLPSLYESMKLIGHAHTYVFVAFAGEQKGAAGSNFYVQQMTKKQVAETDAMVSLEHLGLGPTEVWVTRSDQPLSLRLLYLADVLGDTISAATIEQDGGDDVEQFARRKIPRIAIQTSLQEPPEAQFLHPPADDLAAIDLDDYYASYSLLAPFIDYLDSLTEVTSRNVTPPPPPPPDWVFGNPLGPGPGPGRQRGR